MATAHVCISRFYVKSGDLDLIARALRSRPRLVDAAPGFVSMWAGQGATDPHEFVVEIRFTDSASFDAWHRSHGFHDAHAAMPDGVRLDPERTGLLRMDLLSE